ncbi:MAG: hypothetical protein GF364_15735 [Candidatus Lokiarchaeota archaeon]|nr:hypothetical protein [Candidatus Lokiarchaeota archaeon]
MISIQKENNEEKIKNYQQELYEKKHKDLILREKKLLGTLEDTLNLELPLLKDIQYQSLGYCKFEGYITGVGLYRLGLKEFPPILAKMKKLQTISLVKNKLKNLNGMPNKYEDLLYLWLEGNSLRNLTELPEYLPKLKRIGLSFNKLTNLQGFPKRLPNLKHLYLKNNNLKNFNGISQALPKTTFIDAGQNELENFIGLPKSLPSLKKIHVKHNTTLTSKGFPTDLPSMLNLDLSNLAIKNTKLLEKLNLLRKVDLSNNRISSIDFFPKGSHLTSMDLSHNCLHAKSINFELINAGYVCLKQINLSNNQISCLDDIIPKLRYKVDPLFNLNENPLVSLYGLDYTEILQLRNLDCLNLTKYGEKLMKKLHKAISHRKNKNKQVLLQRISMYYRYSTKDLIKKLKKGDKLTDSERERVEHEVHFTLEWRPANIYPEDLISY